MTTFGQRLRRARKSKDITLQELADKLNTNKSTLSRYENNKREPKLDLIKDLADYLNVSVDYLLGRSNVKRSENEIKQALENNPDLIQFWEQLSERNDLQLLFKQTQNLSPKAIRKVVEFMQMIENEHRKEG